MINIALCSVIVLSIFWASSKINKKLDSGSQESLSRAEARLKEEIIQLRQELQKDNLALREKLSEEIKGFGANNEARLDHVRKTMDDRLLQMEEGNSRRFEELRQTVDQKLEGIRQNNDQKLEEMRKTVDEKLHDTLEKRLGESFSLVSQRLERVHQGLGEMQSLASNVGDLKKVLTNIKTRGTWGEVQLSSLLQEMLAPGQYEANVAVNPENPGRRVEFAVRLPGGGSDGPVYLPIDAKFPLDAYDELLKAQEAGDVPDIQKASKSLETRVKGFAKDVRDKYIHPPYTTDFAVIFVPLEGLYAELIRRDGLQEQLQREFRVMLAGPTTLSALLTSLQMGFSTLAIKERSNEVWNLLSAVKTGFDDFGELLDKTRKKLDEAGKSIDNASRKTRSIKRKLRDIGELPQQEAHDLLDWNKETTEIPNEELD